MFWIVRVVKVKTTCFLYEKETGENLQNICMCLRDSGVGGCWLGELTKCVWASLRFESERNIYAAGNFPHIGLLASLCLHLPAVLWIRIRDPVPFWPLDPGSEMGKKSGSGSRMKIPDHISESLETIFWDKNTWILWCGSGSGINNPDPQHWLPAVLRHCYLACLRHRWPWWGSHPSRRTGQPWFPAVPGLKTNNIDRIIKYFRAQLISLFLCGFTYSNAARLRLQH